MNPFQSSYIQRLQEWRQLRLLSSTLSPEQACVEIDRWWQQAPWVNHHLHWSDQENWPDPWTMLSENLYCPLTRAVGMCYTLLLSREDMLKGLELIYASDSQAEEHYLVSVDSKYILNYWPNTVKDNKISDFTIINRISIEPLIKKVK